MMRCAGRVKPLGMCLSARASAFASHARLMPSAISGSGCRVEARVEQHGQCRACSRSQLTPAGPDVAPTSPSARSHSLLCAGEVWRRLGLAEGPKRP